MRKLVLSQAIARIDKTVDSGPEIWSVLSRFVR
jgi:hypothetical protein